MLKTIDTSKLIKTSTQVAVAIIMATSIFVAISTSEKEHADAANFQAQTQDELIPKASYAPYDSLARWYEAQAKTVPDRPIVFNETTTGVYELATDGNFVYIGFGASSGSAKNGAGIGEFNIETNELKYVGSLDEQGIRSMVVAQDGTLVIAGEDPAYVDSWQAGNAYLYKQGGEITKLRNRLGDTLIARTTTDANGNYEFSGVKPTHYEVKFIPPAGKTLTPSEQTYGENFHRVGQGTDGVSDPMVDTGRAQICGPDTLPRWNSDSDRGFGGDSPFADWQSTNIDAGMIDGQSAITANAATPDETSFAGGTSIGGSVWEDANVNKAEDAGEAKLANITVELYSKDPIFPCELHGWHMSIDTAGDLYFSSRYNSSFRSQDNGQTWEPIVTYRADGITDDIQLYAYDMNKVGNSIIMKGSFDGGVVPFITKDDGDSWSSVFSDEQKTSLRLSRGRLVLFGNELLTNLSSRTATIGLGENGEVNQYDLPDGYKTLYSDEDIQTIGDTVYIPGISPANHFTIISTKDFQNWEEVEIADDLKSVYNFSASSEISADQNFMYITSKGEAGTIHKIDLSQKSPLVTQEEQPAAAPRIFANAPPSCSISFVDNQVIVEWEEAEGGAAYGVHRVSNDDPDTLELRSLTDKLRFVDTSKDAKLLYGVRTINEDESVSAFTICIEIAAPIQALSAPEPVAACEFSISEQNINVSWDKIDGISQYIVYRTADGSQQYWRGRTDQGSFTDTNRNASFEYFVVTKNSDGVKSEPIPCENLNPTPPNEAPVAIASCAAVFTEDKADVSWTDAGAGIEYVVSRTVNDSPKYWRVKTEQASFTDSTRNGSIKYFLQTLENGKKSDYVACS